MTMASSEPGALPSSSDRAAAGSIVLTWMVLFGAAMSGLVGPNRSAIEAEYHISHTAFGWAFCVIQVVCGLLGLFLGRWTARLAPSRVLLLAFAFVAAGFGVVCCTRGAGALAIGWTVLTFGTVLSYVSNTISQAVWREEPRRGLLLLHALNGVGKVSGPVLSAIALAYYWRWSFAFVGALTALATVAVWRLLGVVDRVAPPHPPVKRQDSSVRLDPTFWTIVLLFALLNGAESSLHTLMPLFYERVHHTTASTASLLFTAHLGGLAVGRLATVFLPSRISHRALIAACLSTVVFMPAAILTTNMALRIVALFLTGGTHSSTFATLYAHSAEAMRHNPRALDYGAAFGCLSGIAVAVIVSSQIAETSITAGMWFSVAVLIAFGLAYFTARLGGPERASG